MALIPASSPRNAKTTANGGASKAKPKKTVAKKGAETKPVVKSDSGAKPGAAKKSQPSSSARKESVIKKTESVSKSPKTNSASGSGKAKSPESKSTNFGKSAAKSQPEVRAKGQEAKASQRTVRAKSSAGVPAVEPKGAVVRKSAPRQTKGAGRPVLLEGELPQEYGVDRLVAIARDPDWTHLYWELSPETRQKMSNVDGGFRLRGFDTTGVLFDGRNAPVALDIELAPYARSWYVKLPYQGRVYTFEYGMVNREGEWNGLARSLPVGFEPGMLGLSPESEEWISIASDELFRAASGLADGEGIQDLIRRLRERSSGSGAMLGSSRLGESGAGFLGLAPSSSLGSSDTRLNLPTSYMSSSMGSGTSFTGLSSGQFQPPKDKSKDFWLWVETELILYGATEPDAQVTLMGKPLQLNPDGTFRVHFPFPNGTELHMDVRAVDRTGEMERTARPAAKRWTN